MPLAGAASLTCESKAWILNHAVHKDGEVVFDHEGLDIRLLVLLTLGHQLHKAPSSIGKFFRLEQAL